jgi:hypothetical protein
LPESSVTIARAKLAANKRHYPEANHDTLSRNLAEANLAAYITRVVDAAPPLTPEQRDKLAALLRPVGGGAS